jgi:nucleoside-diphosphate-sugar epimerase
MNDRKIVIPGGAGLVGQNLVAVLKKRGYANLVVLDKHRTNLAKLEELHPDVTAEVADVAEPGQWERHFERADTVVMLQAQIGAHNAAPFVRNNIESTRLVIEQIRRYGVPYTVHISSSVVESVAHDDYTETKRAQEKLVLESGIPCVVLRPTLMFGWFDRKHLGWLSRFLRRVPVFPVPGHGRYMRQPLYAGDFCAIIAGCIEKRICGEIYNISGVEQVDYIDIIRTIKRATEARTPIVRIPYGLFRSLLKLWNTFDRNSPFTVDQLASLVAGDEFEVIDWPGIFDVRATPFEEAVFETFRHPVYGKVVLDF